MRLYGRIETSFWQNQKVRCLSEGGRMLYLYLLTCPHGNSAGCFVLHDGYIQADLSWVSERVHKHVTELVDKGFIERDERTSLTRIVGWWGHNTFENQNVAKGAIKVMKALPRCQVLSNEINDLKQFDNGSVNELVTTFKNEFLNNTQPPEPEPEPEPKPKPEPEPEPRVPKEPETRAREVPDPAKASDRIFDHWNSHDALTRHRALTAKMRGAINARLKAGHSESDLCRAITHYAELCQRERAPGHNQWGLYELMSRDEGQWIDRMLNPKYRGIQSSRPSPGHTKRSQQNVENVQDWVKRSEQHERK